jgi:hypothetical protein
MVFGDSTLEWGISPPIVEQITGLKVATIATNSLLLNGFTVDVFDQLIREYLKPSGRVVLFFTDWTQQQGFDQPSPWAEKHLRERNSGYVEAMRQVARCNSSDLPADTRHVSREQPEKNPFTTGDLASHQDRLKRAQEYLALRFHLRLPEVDLYAKHLEPVVNPTWAGLKKGDRLESFYRWDSWTVMRRLKDQIERSAQNSEPPQKVQLVEDQIRTSKHIRSKNWPRLTYTVPITRETHHPVPRDFYHALYADFAELIDLPALQPAEDHYEMEAIHAANASLLYQSALFAQALKALK